jgi:hypothetical protein
MDLTAAGAEANIKQSLHRNIQECKPLNMKPLCGRRHTSGSVPKTLATARQGAQISKRLGDAGKLQRKRAAGCSNGYRTGANSWAAVQCSLPVFTFLQVQEGPMQMTPWGYFTRNVQVQLNAQ